MSKFKYIAGVAGWVTLALWLTACGGEATSQPGTTATAPVQTTQLAPTATVGSVTTAPTKQTTNPVPTQAPVNNTTAASSSLTTNATSTTAPAPSGAAQTTGKDLYLDDHSNPVQVLRSYYNAINRQEYVRAYSYWNSQNAQPYNQFEQGYKDTANVELYAGQVSASAAAGTTYYAAPISLKATKTNGTTQFFAGCVLFRFGNPANYGQPPFRPLVIDKAAIQSLTGSANAAQIMQQACQAEGAPAPDGPIPLPQPNDDTAVDPARYLDDRSSPTQLIRSYYNAINRHEYVRAFSYWASAGQPQSYEQFEKGFQSTAGVKITLGTPERDAGAGQLYTKLPISVTATQADKTTEVYSGCYTLHQSQPGLFGAPPFVPLSINQASLQKVQTANSGTVAPPQTCR